MHDLALPRLTGAVVLVGSFGCKNGATVQTLPAQEPAQRAAESFVHCVETGNTLCVEAGQGLGGWDALRLLVWLGSGSPVGVVEALPQELAAHTDPLKVQARFVKEVERYAFAVRGAECEATDMRSLAPLIDEAAQHAIARMQELGLWHGDVTEVVGGLAREAHEQLDGGELVRLDCAHDPFRLYIPVVEEEQRLEVVGMMTLLPTELGGEPLAREHIAERLRSAPLGLEGAGPPIQQGVVHPWIPIPTEVF